MSDREERHRIREERQRIVRERRAEARRLLDEFASPRLRILTVTCVADHKLLEVFGISGQQVWAGNTRVVRADGSNLKPTGDHRARRCGLLGDPEWMPDRVYGPRGNCRCGNWGIGSAWLLEQVARTDLPKTRRVVAPWATLKGATLNAQRNTRARYA